MGPLTPSEAEGIANAGPWRRERINFLNTGARKREGNAHHAAACLACRPSVRLGPGGVPLARQALVRLRESSVG